MASTIKVDQIQLSDGSTPTVADLGLDDAGRILKIQSSDDDNSYTTNSESYTQFGPTFEYTPVSTDSHLLITLELRGRVLQAGTDNDQRIAIDIATKNNSGSWVDRNDRVGFEGGVVWGLLNVTSSDAAGTYGALTASLLVTNISDHLYNGKVAIGSYGGVHSDTSSGHSNTAAIYYGKCTIIEISQ